MGRFTLAGMIGLAICLNNPGFGASRVLADNTWISIPPKWSIPAGLPQGGFQERGWGTLRYNSTDSSVIFYEGYGPSTHGTYCIYGNALYEFRPSSDTTYLRSLSNWYCQYNPPTELAENKVTPTPKDRHTYSQFAYVPDNHSIYLASGASGSGLHENDFWRYSLKDKTWEPLGEIPGTRKGECYCELNLIYANASKDLYFFQKPNVVMVYNVPQKSWRKVETTGTVASIGGHGAYDPKRNLFVFYGNNWSANEEGNTCLATFDIAKNAWSQATPAGTWPPPKSYATIEYSSRWDVYVMHGGWKHNDTWVYYPQTKVWSPLAVTNPPPASTVSTYFTYDQARNLLVAFLGKKMWVLQFKPEMSLSLPHPLQGQGSIRVEPIRGGRDGLKIEIGEANEPILLSLVDPQGKKMDETRVSMPNSKLHWTPNIDGSGLFFLHASKNRDRVALLGPYFLTN